MRLKLSDTEYAEVRQLKRNMVGTPDYVKVTCILMFSNGRSPKTISEDLGISPATIYRYIGQYQDSGLEELESLLTLNFRLVNSQTFSF